MVTVNNWTNQYSRKKSVTDLKNGTNNPPVLCSNGPFLGLDLPIWKCACAKWNLEDRWYRFEWQHRSSIQ
ncbi:hypothetical protein RclHR1_01380010 [Rhizophagus clarus]|uniref:Uncharacterized protein n=1 Tax=Rhizophagus clarus TaxID=94130 RepID=A0A2Z6R3J4_9GLOM|nr:hypothetical protein RclHR1_01380010 [Rhizophagus clarus]